MRGANLSVGLGNTAASPGSPAETTRINYVYKVSARSHIRIQGLVASEEESGVEVLPKKSRYWSYYFLPYMLEIYRDPSFSCR